MTPRSQHYGYSRAEFEKLTIRNLQAFDNELPWLGDRGGDEQAARTWKHVRADGALIDLAIYSPRTRSMATSRRCCWR